VRRLRSPLLLPFLAVALTAAGCGSDASSVEEVPGSPPVLAVPHQKGADDLSTGEAGATPTPTPGTDAEATPTPAGTGATGTTGTTGGTGTTGTTTGAAATPAPATQDSPTSDQAPAAGAATEKFEQFCEENAGAC